MAASHDLPAVLVACGQGSTPMWAGLRPHGLPSRLLAHPPLPACQDLKPHGKLPSYTPRPLSHAQLSHGQEVPTPAATLKLPTRPSGIRSVRVPATGSGICTLSVQTHPKTEKMGLITTLRDLGTLVGPLERPILDSDTSKEPGERQTDRLPHAHRNKGLKPNGAEAHPHCFLGPRPTRRGCRVVAESRMLCNSCRPCFTQLSANWAPSLSIPT